MQTPPSGQAERLPFKTKLAFGIGSAAESIAIYTVSSFALLFYNQVLGVPAHLIGLALSFTLILDGLVEPMVGSLSDRTKGRFGRRHGYMYAAPVPIGLTLYLIFNPPAGFSELALTLWCGVTVGLLRQVMSFFHTPHLALGAELSPHYVERSKVMAYNSFFTWAGTSATSWLALSYFFPATAAYPRGLLNPEPWPRYALAVSVLTVVILFASAWFTRDRIPFLPQLAKDTPRFSIREFFRDVGRAMANINYVWLLVGYFFLSLMLGLREGLRLYSGTFYWELTSEDLRWYIVGSFAGYLAAFLFAARLHGRFDKKPTIIISGLVYAIVPAIPLTLGMMGILTPETPYLLPILIAFAAVAFGGISILSITVLSALADIADENELKYGVRQEGILYSTRALFAKVDQAIGAALAGFVITLIALPVKATPGEIPDDVLYNLALWDGLIAAIPGVLAAFTYSRIRVTRRSHEANKAALAERRAGRATVGPEPAEAIMAGVDDGVIPPTARP